MTTTDPSASPSRIAALIVAAGRGERAGGNVPKQYQRLGSLSVLAHSINAMALPGITDIVCVIAPDAQAAYDDAVPPILAEVAGRLLPACHGAQTRQGSVLAGLETLAKLATPPDLVLVHDAARPFASAALVRRAIEAAQAYGAAVPGIPVTDTIKRVGADGEIVESPQRSALRAVQTPQAFRFAALLEAHRSAARSGTLDLTDDASVMEWAGHEVRIFEGEAANMKLTTADDFARSRAMETRVGSGYDVHAFGPGNAVMLGGIAIPHDKALAGHSDADVVLHALTDAILGALADGDIGSHFPPSDPQWRGASSDRFLAFAVERVRARGGMILHLDCTVICEAPKIGPHRDRMREAIAQICGVALSRVGVKATTSEQLGFTGRREGIAAQAVATVQLPAEEA